MPKTPGEMIATTKAQMKERTGKSFEQWLAVARKNGPPAATALSAWLRQKHGLKPLQADLVSREARSPGSTTEYDDPEKLVDALYSGEASALRPLHDQVVRKILALGNDVELTAAKTYVTLRRKKQFALVRPGSGVLELGLCLGGLKPTPKLAAAKHFGSERVTHQIAIGKASEVAGETMRWLKAAFALAG
jgi:hypothetical protein